jgi:hypothetical protein
VLYRVFDATERAVAPKIEAAVQSEALLDALSLAVRIQGRARRALEASTSAAVNALSIPTAAEVARLRLEMSRLERDLRRVQSALECEREQKVLE